MPRTHCGALSHVARPFKWMVMGLRWEISFRSQRVGRPLAILLCMIRLRIIACVLPWALVCLLVKYSACREKFFLFKTASYTYEWTRSYWTEITLSKKPFSKAKNTKILSVATSLFKPENIYWINGWVRSAFRENLMSQEASPITGLRLLKGPLSE